MIATIPFISVPSKGGVCMSQLSSEVGAPAFPWTGPIHLDLLDIHGWPAGTAEMYVSVDTLTLRFDGRTLAFMVRDFFRAWINRPGQPYMIDDAIWSVDGDALCLTVNDRLLYAEAADALDVLRQLL
jgi:hypothetical protein